MTMSLAERSMVKAIKIELDMLKRKVKNLEVDLASRPKPRQPRKAKDTGIAL